MQYEKHAERHPEEAVPRNHPGENQGDANFVCKEETDWQHYAVCVGEGQAVSCVYNTEKTTVGHITVEISDSGIRSDICVMPTDDPKTFVAWIRYPDEDTMHRMFTVQHLNDWDVEHSVIERYLHDVVKSLAQTSEEVN